jgi:iron complex transport system substrate-binding protein
MPQRIISLTPSLTEILFALECGHRVVGVTDSCDYPAAVGDLPNVGCWFDPDVAKLMSLNPDLVLGLQTAHRQLQPELESHGIRFIPVNPLTVEGAIADIARIGEILGVHAAAERLVSVLAAPLLAEVVHDFEILLFAAAFVQREFNDVDVIGKRSAGKEQHGRDDC